MENKQWEKFQNIKQIKNFGQKNKNNSFTKTSIKQMLNKRKIIIFRLYFLLLIRFIIQNLVIS